MGVSDRARTRGWAFCFLVSALDSYGPVPGFRTRAEEGYKAVAVAVLTGVQTDELKALLELKEMSAAHSAFWKVTWHFLGHVGQTLCKLLCVY